MNSQNQGITGISRGLARLQTPPHVPQGEVWRYGYGFPFQVSPTQAAVLANIHRKQARTDDFEVGADAIVFDDPRRLIPDHAVAVTRIHREMNPNAGEMSDMVKHCPVGGFVPFGAKRVDGSPHPHAGTGFGWGLAMACAIDDGDLNKPYRGYFAGAQTHIYYELHQFAFDGETFRVTAMERLSVEELLPGHRILNAPMRMAIPDGDDLLSAGVIGWKGTTASDVMAVEKIESGILRWRCQERGWRPVSFTPVATGFSNFEPSLIRDVDGALLFSVRPGYEDKDKHSVLVWRSRDNGVSWKKIIDVKNLRYQSPITLNQAADGTPYIVCNHWVSALMDYEGTFMDGQGRTTCREMLCLWPLNPARDGLLSPHIVRFPRYEYGPPPTYDGTSCPAGAFDRSQTIKGRDWTCDHPTATTVRLGDGRWHNLLCYRLLAQAEVQGGILPTPHSGFCIEEVLSAGPPQPEWSF